jgi:hypothetical protein
MQFIHPLLLVALGTLAIPILIHLFNFRRFKKVYFTNVRLLQEIQQETKKQSQLRQLLILLARLLVIASLVIAFAQPYLPSSRQQKKITGQRSVSIYLDNSFSMEAVASDGRLLDLAKNKALEIVSAYAPSDVFQLVTNDFEGRHQRFVSPEDMRKMVEEVQASPAGRTMPEVINRQNDMLTETGRTNYDAYLISDFQKTTSRLNAAKPDTNISWFLVPLSSETRNNLFIDSVYFLSPVHQPGQPVGLRVRIHNASSMSLDKVPVKVTINSVQKALAGISVQANSTTEITLSYTENSPGVQYGLVEIVDYPIVYDDKFYFAYLVSPAISVLSINEKNENKYLNALFGNDSSVQFTNNPVKQIDYKKLFSNALLILNSPDEISSGLAQELNRFVRSGGNLVIFPPINGKTDSYNTFLSLFNLSGYSSIDTVRQRLAGINTESELFNDVFEKNVNGRIVLPENIDLPIVFRHYFYKPDIRSGGEILCKLQDNQPFLMSAPVEKGKIYLFCTPLDEAWTMFPKHMIFVPTLYKIALLSNPSPPLYHIAGEPATIEIAADSLIGTNIYKLKKTDSDYEFIPEIRKFGASISLFTHDQVRDAGFYMITNGGNPVSGLAFNFNRRESELICYNNSELEEQIKRLPVKDIRIIKEKKSSIVSDIHQIKQGTPLWKLFIILALIFLAAEIALIRLLKQH